MFFYIYFTKKRGLFQNCYFLGKQIKLMFFIDINDILYTGRLKFFFFSKTISETENCENMILRFRVQDLWL